jgi:selenocysteine lyase/cysteine desulfurase
MTSRGYSAYTGATGTRGADNFIALGAAIDYLNAFDMDQVQAHNLALRHQAYAALVALAIPGLVMVSPSPDLLVRVHYLRALLALGSGLAGSADQVCWVLTP